MIYKLLRFDALQGEKCERIRMWYSTFLVDKENKKLINWIYWCNDTHINECFRMYADLIGIWFSDSAIDTLIARLETQIYDSAI